MMSLSSIIEEAYPMREGNFVRDYIIDVDLAEDALSSVPLPQKDRDDFKWFVVEEIIPGFVRDIFPKIRPRDITVSFDRQPDPVIASVYLVDKDGQVVDDDPLPEESIAVTKFLDREVISDVLNLVYLFQGV